MPIICIYITSGSPFCTRFVKICAASAAARFVQKGEQKRPRGQYIRAARRGFICANVLTPQGTVSYN